MLRNGRMQEADRQPQSRDTVNRRGLLLALIPLLLSVLALAGWLYASHDDTADRTWKVGAERRGSDNYELLQALADKATSDGEGIRLTVFQTAGSSESLKLLEDGIIDFAAIPADAISRPDLAMVANLYPDTYHLIARRDAGIASVRDLVGKRVGLPAITSSEYRSFWYVIDQYTVQPERFIARPYDQDDAIIALRNREIDAMFVMRAPGNRRLKWLADAAQIDIIEIDQASAMQVKRPALRPVTLAKGVYSGTPAIPDRTITTVAADRILVTRAAVPDDVVRQVTATLFENQRELSLSSRLAGFVSQPALTGATLLPVHPGAIAFYNRDQPSFFQENAEPIGVTVSVAAILMSLLLWAKRRWEEGQKGRIDVYNLDLLRMTSDARTATTGEALDKLRTDLFEMLDRVVHDLDSDKIDGQGFQYFAFTWRVALDAINGRKAELDGAAPSADRRPSSQV
jgi:TRAP transporter TAXI family solute receptor